MDAISFLHEINMMEKPIPIQIKKVFIVEKLKPHKFILFRNRMLYLNSEVSEAG